MQHRINGSPKIKKTNSLEAAITMSAPDKIALSTRQEAHHV